MAMRLAVAISSVWPPDRKKMPGTAAGTWRDRAGVTGITDHCTVYWKTTLPSRVRWATCWGAAWSWARVPLVTMLGLSTVPSR